MVANKISFKSVNIRHKTYLMSRVALFFRAANHWAWVPVVACSLGGVLGAIVYIITIELHHPSPHPSDNNPDIPYLPVNAANDCTEGQL